MAHWRQGEVAVSRFLRHVVAGQEHPDPPRRERDEFNRVQGIPDPSYETLIAPVRRKWFFTCFCTITMMRRSSHFAPVSLCLSSPPNRIYGAKTRRFLPVMFRMARI